MHEFAPEAVVRLAGGGEPFLQPHHVEAAGRLAQLFERSQMRQRVTMSYDPTRTGGKGGQNQQSAISDSAADAHRRFHRLAQTMPADCWNVLIDLCVFDKGLQQVEAERLWPRRSGKLVLRIGLDAICLQMGLSEAASGGAHAVTGWLAQRPEMFPDED